MDSGSDFSGFGGAGIQFKKHTSHGTFFLDLNGTGSSDNGGSGAALLRIGAEFSLHNCDFNNNGGAGLIVDEDSNIHIETSNITGNAGAGIIVLGDGILDADTSTISSNTGHGIEVSGGGDASVSGSTIANNGGYGVYVASGGRATLAGNSISGNALGSVGMQDRVNVASSKPVEADSYIGTYVPANATDGDSSSDSSRWISDSTSNPHWIAIDLQQEYMVDEARFWTGEGGFNEPIANYQLQAWDEGLQSWTTIISRTGNTSSAVVETFTAVSTSKIRLLTDSGTQVKLYELEIYSNGV
ncbi:MAG: hypothetical protein HC888_06295 [Candidatus Competibacteraceae bacterium]|nr:hypothetical protein [Candidatus Competibacteraceae bacterium]